MNRYTLTSIVQKLMVMLILANATGYARAQTGGGFSVPGLRTLACSIINWMTGELAVIIFFVVGVATLLVGMMMKMDWAKIVSLIVMFGIVQGFLGMFGSYITGGFAC